MEDSTLRNEGDIIDWIETINLTTVVDLTGNAGECGDALEKHRLDPVECWYINFKPKNE